MTTMENAPGDAGTTTRAGARQGRLIPDPAVPPESPLEMPAQDFSAPPPQGPAFVAPSVEVLAARLISFGGRC